MLGTIIEPLGVQENTILDEMWPKYQKKIPKLPEANCPNGDLIGIFGLKVHTMPDLK